jgi:hypothetical protein
VLKKFSGVLIVLVVAAVGMTASTALALRMVRPADEPDLYRPAPSDTAKQRKAHPWDEPCATANTEVTVLETSLDYGAPSYQELGGELISINVRLLVTLRQKDVEGAAARRFLARFERGIADDRVGLAHALNPAALERWIAQSQEGNATLATLAKRMGAPQCAEYFGN